jgi:hypothetical protein
MLTGIRLLLLDCSDGRAHSGADREGFSPHELLPLPWSFHDNVSRYTSRFGDLVQRIRNGSPFPSPGVITGVSRQIALADDANHPVAVVYNGQPANLVARHHSETAFC